MVWWYLGWLVMGTEGVETGSTTVRNLGLVAGGLIAIWVAIWRGVVADRQAKASQDQAETMQRGQLNERYQRGAEMLGSEILHVRLGGIYALQRLAQEDPKQYRDQIMVLLSVFVDTSRLKDREVAKQVITMLEREKK